MEPLGKKILVRDIIEEKKSEAGLILDFVKEALKKVEIVSVSKDSDTSLQPGDICLSNYGGVELEKGLWLCNENILDAKL